MRKGAAPLSWSGLLSPGDGTLSLDLGANDARRVGEIGAHVDEVRWTSIIEHGLFVNQHGGAGLRVLQSTGS